MSLLPWKRHQPQNVPVTTQMSPLQQDMQRMFDRFFGRLPGSIMGLEPFGNVGNLMGNLNYPAISVSDSGDNVLVRAEVPGLESKDVELSVEGNILTLRGEKREEIRDEKENFFYHERSFGSFIRRIELPCHVNSEKAEAHLEKGILSLTLPKIVGESCKTIRVQES
ncbi:Hsp20/alpha crystallin family protein [Nannocystis radixulma]|uniref:Hsp20/alpha crystallin family protein n=1 Tax=Nannocystis radixulma TaxID=2995305 RepID=A0ABT5B6E5_9BACT|nr:Hsp20/alpha crystallin family protein [Nannocystis radixulma]MDC0669687.1 Hsp20/alpha crystallin family protein [Nannocystis radixulma]